MDNVIDLNGGSARDVDVSRQSRRRLSPSEIKIHMRTFFAGARWDIPGAARGKNGFGKSSNDRQPEPN